MQGWFSASATPDEDYQQGIKFLQVKDFRQALIAFDKALKIDAKHEPSQLGKFNSLYQLAVKAKAENDLEMTELYFRQAHDVKPEEQKALAELASVRRQRYVQKQAKQSAANVAPSVLLKPAAVLMPIHNLIFQGGGIKELACLGALHALTEHMDLSQVKRVGGNSAGAILATLWGVGYSLTELEEMLKKINFTEFMDGAYREELLALGQRQEQVKQLGKDLAANVKQAKHIQNPFASSSGSVGLSKASSNVDVKMIKRGLALLNNETDFGLFPGDYFRKWLESCLQAKTGIAHLTFKEWQTLRSQQPEVFKDSKEIYLVGANISTGMTEVFSHETTPDMIISDAVRISISIPLVFRPHRPHIKNGQGQRVPTAVDHWYVDGGLLDNYPLWLFDKAKYVPDSQLAAETVVQNPYSLGLRLVDKKLKLSYQTGTPLSASEVPTSLAGYAWQLLHTVHRKQESHHYHFQEQLRTIYIDHNGILATQFDLSAEQQQQLLDNGKAAVKEYFAAQANSQVTQTKKDEKQEGILAISKALADAKKQEETLEYAVEINAVQKARQLLSQGIKPKLASAQEPSLLDKALLKNNKAMVVALIEGGLYQCQQPKAVQVVLATALQSEFVDKASLTAHLQAFEKQHNLVAAASALPMVAPG